MTRVQHVRHFGTHLLQLVLRRDPPAYVATVQQRAVEVIDAELDRVVDLAEPVVVATWPAEKFNPITFNRFASRTEAQFDNGQFDSMQYDD